ncbi:MAG: right-handed parallel beta-helix repeat-containing protein [Candidatus Kaiserbacteria bacterium]|nr:right-handed parallel beta-helix repeat-containing protein [Candidatus Kaiserbacteria bacterium]
MRAKNAALFFISIALLIPHFANADTLSADEYKIPGVTEGEGSSFQITDSDYLNIGLNSTEAIKVRIESMPRMILMHVESASGTATTTGLTITGLKPGTTYYMYQDNYHSLTPFSSDENGAYSYTQDISKSHLIFIQPKKSTKFIRNDATGGDCASFGNWDSSTATCTLTTDLTETMEIDSNNITIDGNGHTTTGSDTGMGIYLTERTGVTVKNLTFKNFSFGIFFEASSHNTVSNNSFIGLETAIYSYDDSPFNTFDTNTFLNNGEVFSFYGNSNNSVVHNNTINADAVRGENEFRGIFIYDSNNNTIEGNHITVTNSAGADPWNNRGIFIYNSSDNTISSNTVSGVLQELFLYNSSKNNIYNNTLSDASEALFVYGSSDNNKIYHNNFVNNGENVMDYSGMINSFNLTKPTGGNYFDSFDEPAEGCEDKNADGFCGAPNVFTENEHIDRGQDDFPWTTQNGWDNATSTSSADYSSVLFLPGIEGSRLYEGTGCGKSAEEKLWEPIADSILDILRGAGDDKVHDLFLDESGDSACDDIYVKTNDILDSVRGSNIYKSFIDEMNGLKSSGAIADWKPVAYDWRLSLDDLLSNGTERDGKIYYEDSTSTPYIEQTLRSLARTSNTRKVTIVAHSNGGLVAKALLNKLGNTAAAKLVDKVIMVGAPQIGAPEAVGSLLVGYDTGIYKYGFPIVSNSAARELAENSPMAYHLLPSQNYFDSVMDDPNHPVARFAGDAYAKEISAYGNAIGTADELDDFLLASTTLNANLIDYANVQHSVLDSWTPPAGIEIDQIAGWGADDTVAGIDFYTSFIGTDAITAFDSPRKYRPIFTEDGDGVVPVPSALMIASSTSVKRYWVDLVSSSIKHKDMFEDADLRTFIKNIITDNTSSLPTTISATPPTTSSTKKLTFFLHSPLTLQLTDSSGNVTGIAEDNSMKQDIPDSTYGEFGEVKYITVPEGGSYQLTMHGQDSGTFSLDMQETLGGIITASSTIANVPTTASTLASLTISNGIDTASVLTVDENGDGKNVANITPKVGETVIYDSSMMVAPTSYTPSTGSRRSHSSSSVASIPKIVTTVVNNLAITAPPKIFQTKISPIQFGIKKVTSQATPQKNATTSVPQIASAYTASQQPLIMQWGSAVYNGLYGFWSALKKFF